MWDVPGRDYEPWENMTVDEMEEACRREDQAQALNHFLAWCERKGLVLTASADSSVDIVRLVDDYLSHCVGQANAEMPQEQEEHRDGGTTSGTTDDSEGGDDA